MPAAQGRRLAAAGSVTWWYTLHWQSFLQQHRQRTHALHSTVESTGKHASGRIQSCTQLNSSDNHVATACVCCCRHRWPSCAPVIPWQQHWRSFCPAWSSCSSPSTVLAGSRQCCGLWEWSPAWLTALQSLSPTTCLHYTLCGLDQSSASCCQPWCLQELPY
jgi:hypothetical protein